MYQVYVPTRSHVSMYFYPLPKPRATAVTRTSYLSLQQQHHSQLEQWQHQQTLSARMLSWSNTCRRCLSHLIVPSHHQAGGDDDREVGGGGGGLGATKETAAAQRQWQR